MKATILIAGLQVAIIHALPQVPQPRVPSFSNLQTVAEPASCKVIAGDAGWPSAAEWKKALPNSLVREKSTKNAKHPDYRIEVTDRQHVIAAVKFAAKHNVRLSIINSGHDFMGRNDAPSGLHIGVGRLDGVRVSKTFTPTTKGEAPLTNEERPKQLNLGKGEGGYVTFGAGYSTQRLNNALASNNLFTIGAAHGEVTVAGGWAQASGHTPLGPHYGMGADQVAEYQVVTADGQLRIANKVSNPDLFWALRGGGGGAWGVVVQATVKAHASPKMVSANWYINTTDYNDNKSIFAPSAWLHTKFPELVDKQGWSGYYFIYPNAIKCSFLNIDEAATKENAEKVWKPIVDKFAEFPGINKNTLVTSISEIPSYKAFLDAAFGSIEEDKPAMNMGGPAPVSLPGTDAISCPTVATTTHAKRHGPGKNDDDDVARPKCGKALPRRFFGDKNLQRRHGPGEDISLAALGAQAGGVVAMDSRLLGAEAFNDARFADALEKAMPQMDKGQLRGNLVAGGKVSTLGQDTSVNPAWRKAYTHLIATGYGSPEAPSLRMVAPDMGAYSNEASANETDWKISFFGSHYARLSEVKSKYDPNGVFWVTPGVNADHFHVVKGRVCRTPEAEMAAYSRTAPLNDNQNPAQEGDSDADGAGFPLLWNGTAIVEAPKPAPVKPMNMANMGQS